MIEALKLKSERLKWFCFWLLGGFLLYLIDCLLAFLFDVRPDLPWFKRGIFFAPLVVITVGWVVFPIIDVIAERIETRPR